MTGNGLAVELTGLTKRYGDRTAVDGLDLSLPAGRVTGFVGPNGAGKTTTIRMLLGLASPTAGEGHVLGVPLDRPGDYLRRVGAMVEGPASYGSLSGRDELRVLARLAGVDDRRVAEVLDTVGLADRARDRVRGYSLGMRQRLGIAAALLPRPELLVLDEPTNGLDPAGIRDVRALLSQLAATGTTVLVSSHLLAELEAVADHLVLVDRGRLLFAGATAQLLSSRQSGLVAKPERADQLPDLLVVARALDPSARREGDAVHLTAASARAAHLNRAAAATGIVLVELHEQATDLEQAFFATLETAGAA